MKVKIDSIDEFFKSTDLIQLDRTCQEVAKATVEKLGKLSQTDTNAIYANAYSSTYTIGIISAYHDWLMNQLSVDENVLEGSPLEN